MVEMAAAGAPVRSLDEIDEHTVAVEDHAAAVQRHGSGAPIAFIHVDLAEPRAAGALQTANILGGNIELGAAEHFEIARVAEEFVDRDVNATIGIVVAPIVSEVEIFYLGHQGKRSEILRIRKGPHREVPEIRRMLEDGPPVHLAAFLDDQREMPEAGGSNTTCLGLVMPVPALHMSDGMISGSSSPSWRQ